MSDIFQFESFEQYWSLLFTLIPMALLYGYALYKKERALNLFAKMETLKSISASVSRWKQGFKACLLLLAGLFLVLALWRPQGNPKDEKVRQKGRDIVFLLDVSKSMLAEDLAPNRLERAKSMIKDLVDQMKGDRVGLVVFAGVPVLKCPLTHNTFSFKTFLNKVDVESVGRGGTNIGDAIRLAANRVFSSEEEEGGAGGSQPFSTYKDLILITDGDDHDSFPVEAAEDGVRKGIRLFTVGLGDTYGTRLRGMEYKGQPVISKLNEDLLRKIAFTHPEGKYIRVQTGSADLGKLYQISIASAAKREGESRVTKVWQDWFQIPLFIAIFLLFVEWFLSERKR